MLPITPPCLATISMKQHFAIHICNRNLFIYLGFYIAFNTVQVISRWVVGRAEEISTYSLSGFCTVNCRPIASNYQLSHLRPCRESNPGLRGGRRERCHSATMAPNKWYIVIYTIVSTMIRGRLLFAHYRFHISSDKLLVEFGLFITIFPVRLFLFGDQ